MKTLATDRKTLALIAKQWKNFQENQEIDGKIVKDYVLRSWGRCREMKLDPFGVRPTIRASDKEFAATTARLTSVIKSSKAVMNNVFSILKASESVMVLASSQGIVLHTLRTSPIILKEQSICREECTGTAGIGTCLEEQEPISLIGAEHWYAQLHTMACAAAPIFDRNQNMVGAIGITSSIDTFHSHTMGMIIGAASTISEQLRLRESLEEQRLILGLIDEGVITLTKSGLIKSITQKAMLMLGFSISPEGKMIQSLCTFKGCPPLLTPDFLKMINEPVVISMFAGQNYSCIVSCDCNEEYNTVVLTLREAKRMRELANRITGASAKYSFDDIYGSSTIMKNTIKQAVLAAKNDVTTLILGESGTGKELFAQAIHTASDRRSGPFVTVNCGALPRELIQSELFGYEEGAFTGAKRAGKIGKFELAEGGTIFLDEIGDMPLEAQVNLLRLIQNKEISPLGSRETRTVNVRIIAATNRNLLEGVNQKLFREDLYYRLNVFPIELPALRERGPEDILLLAKYFLEKNLVLRNERKTLPLDSISLLQQYSWPGNIRELENAMERAICLCKGEWIMPSDFPALLQHVSDHKTPQGSLQACAETVPAPSFATGEYETITSALREHRGNVCDTARHLKKSRAYLYKKINQYSIDVADFRKAVFEKRGNSHEKQIVSGFCLAEIGDIKLKKIIENLTETQMNLLPELLLLLKALQK